MTSHPKDLSDELIDDKWLILKNLQADAFAITVRKRPFIKNNEQAL